jgi:methylphosphotriester-DNA--protein-cysteine methyltransferase
MDTIWTGLLLGTFHGYKPGRIYHLPNCAAATRLKPANRVLFATPAEAEVAGYRKAGDCGQGG